MGELEIYESCEAIRAFTQDGDLIHADRKFISTEAPVVFAKTLNDKLSRDRGLTKLGAIVSVAGIAAVGLVGWRVADNIDLNFRSPDLGLDEAFETSPPVLEAETKLETIEIRGTFDLTAFADVTMAVEVEGSKEGLGIDFTGITDADYSKTLWMRMALTSDNEQTNDSLVVTRQGDKVLGVRATVNAADIFMPHVNDFDFRNFIGIRPGDTQEEISKKIYEFVTQDGKHYDKSGGFSCGACGTSAAELFGAASLAAVYAISVDGRQPDLVQRMTETYRLNVESQLAANYGLSLDEVDVEISYDDGTNPLDPPTPEEVKAIYQSKLDDLYQEHFSDITIEYEGVEQVVDVGSVLFEVKPELRYNDDNKPFVYLRLNGGAEIKIQLSGITLDEDIRMAIISNIDEFEERVVSNSSINNTTATRSESDQPPAQLNSNGGVGTEKYGPPAPNDTGLVYDQPPTPNTEQVYDQPPAQLNSNGGVGTEKYGPPAPINSGD